MSVYYNIKLENDDQEEKRFNVDSNSFIPVLNHQERYSVGVKRFKIPTSQIDLYRIYPNRQFLMGHYNATSNTNTKLTMTDLYCK
jgi:hypothetical protein